MAALSMFRFAKGSYMTKAFSNPILRSVNPLTKNIQKNEFALSAVSNKRIRGPPDYTAASSNTGHWKIERYVAIALLPLIPAGIIYPNMACDMGLSAALIAHTHWGLAGVSTDYIHGEILPKILSPLIMFLSIVACAGLFYLNFNDIGFGNAVQLVWTKL